MHLLQRQRMTCLPESHRNSCRLLFRLRAPIPVCKVPVALCRASSESIGVLAFRSSFLYISSSEAEDDSHVCAGCKQPAIWLGRLATERRQCRGSFSPCWRLLVSQPAAWRRTSGLTDIVMIEPCSTCFPVQPLRYAPAAFLTCRRVSFHSMELPLGGIISECTSPLGRHLLSLLQRFSRFSRNETPVGRLHTPSPELMLPALALSHVSCSIFRLSRKHSLLPTSLTRLSMGVPYGFACLELLRAKDGVTTFHTVDPMDDLGAPSTPGVLRFRAGS